MIKPQELRVGNEVNFHFMTTNFNGKVEFISKDKSKDYWIGVVDPDSKILDLYGLDNVDPIPLTPEILNKVGFNKLSGTANVYVVKINEIEISVNIELNYAYIDTKWGQASIKQPIYKYLHQLQNLYYALTGEELNYKP